MIATLITLAYCIVASCYLPFLAFILVTSLAALIAGRKARVTGTPNSLKAGSAFRFLVVIPAHDEEAPSCQDGEKLQGTLFFERQLRRARDRG